MRKSCDENIKHTLKLAKKMICLAEEDNVDIEDMVDYCFVETFLINAGYQGKIFTDESAAIEWLEK